MSGIIPYSDINVSTETVIATHNLSFNLESLFFYLPVSEYTITEKKRGRRKKDNTADPNLDIPLYSIISLEYKGRFKGARLKKKQGKNFFRNSLAVVIIVERGKSINAKISENGKIQMTGCKKEAHYIECFSGIYEHIKLAEEITGESMLLVKNSQFPKVVFNSVMRNKDFKVGFSIQRDKLDTFINVNTNFISQYEGMNTGVIIKIVNKKKYDTFLNAIEVINGKMEKKKVPYTDYLVLLDEKDQKKEKKIKHHTFLIFCSGSVIQSGSGPEMETIYYEIMKLLIDNKEEFKERILDDTNKTDAYVEKIIAETDVLKSKVK